MEKTSHTFNIKIYNEGLMTYQDLKIRVDGNKTCFFYNILSQNWYFT